jgi:hypothetical protein
MIPIGQEKHHLSFVSAPNGRLGLPPLHSLGIRGCLLGKGPWKHPEGGCSVSPFPNRWLGARYGLPGKTACGACVLGWGSPFPRPVLPRPMAAAWPGPGRSWRRWGWQAGGRVAVARRGGQTRGPAEGRPRVRGCDRAGRELELSAGRPR